MCCSGLREGGGRESILFCFFPIGDDFREEEQDNLGPEICISRLTPGRPGESQKARPSIKALSLSLTPFQSFPIRESI